MNNLSSEDVKYCQNHSSYFGLIDNTTVLLNDYKAKFLTGLIFNFLLNLKSTLVIFESCDKNKNLTHFEFTEGI